MRRPWFKQSRQLANDLRYLLLSVEGALAYHAACLHADDEGTLWCVGDRDAVATLARLLVSRRPGADPAWSLAAVEEAVDAGLLDVSADGTVLRVVGWVDDAPGAAPEPRREAPTADDIAAAAAAKRKPGRPLKGAAPMSVNERSARLRFARRQGPNFRDVPAGVTFEAWAAAHPAVARRILDGRNETPASATKPCNETLQRNHAGVRAVSETSEFSETSNDEKRGEKSESPDARGAATKLCNETQGGNGAAGRVSLRDVEDASPFAADVVLSRMSAASGQRIAALGTSTHMDAFAVVARDLMARGGVTSADLVRAGAHVAHVPWIQRQRKPLTVERLSAAGGKTLVELLTGAAACGECGGAPLPDAAPADDEPAEAAAVALGRARYLAADLGGGPTNPPPPGAPAR